MKIYLVGGAVRDQLLGLPILERDFVVVGSSPEAMQSLGFRPVGQDFPVFLHPTTHEEYALARTERKVAKGYQGFEFYTAPDVSLEQDLMRRDFTINAIAIDEANGQLIDPYHGQADLKSKLIRHVSQAFAEDPVRILRAARFAARFADFSIHADTMKLMQDMVKAGEVAALVPERVWQELQKALLETHPERFFEVLKTVGALDILFPEIAQQQNIFTRLPYIKVLPSAEQRFAAILHTLKPDVLKKCFIKWRVPSKFSTLAICAASYAEKYKNLDLSSVEQILDFLIHCDALRRAPRFTQLLAVFDFLMPDAKKIQCLKQAQTAVNCIHGRDLLASGVAEANLINELENQRLQAIHKLL